MIECVTNVRMSWCYIYEEFGHKPSKRLLEWAVREVSRCQMKEWKWGWGYKCKNGRDDVRWNMSRMECMGKGSQSLFRSAERTALAAWLRSTSRPLSIILIIESSRGWFKTSNLSDVSRSRVTIPHSDHSLLWPYSDLLWPLTISTTLIHLTCSSIPTPYV